MTFDENFFKAEEREGFYIKPMMKRAWAAQLEVLQKIDEICVRHNITYYADGGTLLGAIRHGGFIPWDDDIDIEMKRLDYERFLKIAARELPTGYKILNPRTDHGWSGCFSRVINSTDIPLQGEVLQQFHGFPWQAGVDIFPVDYLPVHKAEEDMMLNMLCAVYTLAYAWDKEAMSEEEKLMNLETVESYCNIKFTKDKPYGQQLWNLVDQITAMYWDTEAEAKEVSVAYMLVNNPNYRIPASCYETVRRVPFENISIPIPDGYEQILTACYGKDYMVPKQNAADHEYPYYRIQQKRVLAFYKQNGREIPDYLWE